MVEVLLEKIYSYTYAKSKGALVIKQATIEYNGQLYKTSPIKSTSLQLLNNLKTQMILAFQQQIYLVADISKMNPYVNEPITIVYKLYFTNVEFQILEN
jgi:hypothetical protein